MENEQKLKVAFSESLGIPADQIHDALEYGSATWDSVGHMSLISAIEMEFNIMIETEDLIDMSSFLKAKEILNKYGIQF